MCHKVNDTKYKNIFDTVFKNEYVFDIISNMSIIIHIYICMYFTYFVLPIKIIKYYLLFLFFIECHHNTNGLETLTPSQ